MTTYYSHIVSEYEKELEMTYNEFMNIPHRDDLEKLTKSAFELIGSNIPDDVKKGQKILDYVEMGTVRIGEEPTSMGMVLVKNFISGKDMPTVRISLQKVKIRRIRND